MYVHDVGDAVLLVKCVLCVISCSCYGLLDVAEFILLFLKCALLWFPLYAFAVFERYQICCNFRLSIISVTDRIPYSYESSYVPVVVVNIALECAQLKCQPVIIPCMGIQAG